MLAMRSIEPRRSGDAGNARRLSALRGADRSRLAESCASAAAADSELGAGLSKNIPDH
jgi:hypothetical protein